MRSVGPAFRLGSRLDGGQPALTGAAAWPRRRRCRAPDVPARIAAMERPIAYDKLAREDRFVRMRARRVAEVRMEQGLPVFPDFSPRESIRERVHGILVGVLEAMEGNERTIYIFHDAPWKLTMYIALTVWVET